jgi:Protein of unknown function, DUF488
MLTHPPALTLYDLGYNDVGKHIDLLEKFVEHHDCILVDIRHKAWSKDVAWRDSSLRKMFGKRYAHLPNLGNINYSMHGENIQYVNFDYGLQELGRLMFLQQKSVIVMCACWDRDHCHRLGVVEAFGQMHKMQSSPIKLSDLREFDRKDQAKQVSLF